MGTDPVFYLHHGQVDRLWWLWQRQDLATRQFEYQGPGENVRVFGNNDTHSNATLDDVIQLGMIAESIRVRESMSTESDLLCYQYI
jgi:tyrosinase